MRLDLVMTGALLLCSGSVAALSPPLTYEIRSVERQGCVEAANGVCPLTHEPGATDAIGDDTVFVDLYVQEISVEIGPRVGPGHSVTYDFSKSSVRHGIGPLAGGPVNSVHEASPKEAEEWVGIWIDEDGYATRRPHYYLESGKVAPLHVPFGWAPFLNFTHAGIPYSTNVTPMNEFDYYLRIVSCSLTPSVHDLCDDAGYFEVQAALLEGLPNAIVAGEIQRFRAKVNDEARELVTRPARDVVYDLPAPKPHKSAERPPSGSILASRASSGSTIGEHPTLLPDPTPYSPTTGETFTRLSRWESPGWWVGVSAPALTLLLFLFLALFHRIRKDRALANPTRARIFEAIAAEPGVRVWTLATRLGLDPSTVDHHVGMLRKLHLVEAVEGGQRRLFVNGGTFGADQKLLVLATSAPSVAAVLALVRGRRIVDFSDLQSALRMRPSTASEAVRALEAVGLVVKRREGGRLRVEATGTD